MAASADRLGYPPLLPVGFHRTDLAGLARLCVDYFPTSRTRPKLMNTVTMVASLASRLGLSARLWIAGPFLTEEESPGDCSITMVLTEQVLIRLNPDQREFFDWFCEVPLYDKYRCHNYGIVLDAARPEFERLSTFWYRQYGFHEAARKCGVAEIATPVAMP